MPEQAIMPYLYYEDVEAALEWLHRAYGFEPETSEIMRNGKGIVVHASMTVGGSTLLLGRPGPEYRCPRRTGQTHHNLYIYVDDLDAHYARASAADAKMLSEIEDTPYGDRRYGTEDPEGQRWYFATKVADVPADQWNPSTGEFEGHG